jgi:soluble lytic murein transglycosylase
MLAPTDARRAANMMGRMNTAQGWLWQGKLLQSINDLKGAQNAWKLATENAPGTFFGLRAQDLLSGVATYQSPREIRLHEDTEAEKAATERWLLQTFKLPAVTSALLPQLANDSRLVRGTELWALGWWDDATAEFDALHRSVRETPLALYQLAHHYKNLGVYRSSLLAATRLLVLSNQPHHLTPPYIARLAYPIYYTDLLLPAAYANKLDPLYVATLMRTESNFNPHAISSAEARGLMQMISPTREEVAAKLKRTGITDNDLFRPMVSIEFGTSYLRSLRDALNNDPAVALMAYNAGPGYALQMMGQSGGDIDRLYQVIDIEETRQYIEFTYETYAMYRMLYGVDLF